MQNGKRENFHPRQPKFFEDCKFSILIQRLSHIKKSHNIITRGNLENIKEENLNLFGFIYDLISFFIFALVHKKFTFKASFNIYE
jgi:hypothetical protein